MKNLRSEIRALLVDEGVPIERADRLAAALVNGERPFMHRPPTAAGTFER